MNIDFSFETLGMFAEYNQSDRVDFCINELKKLKWITIAKVLSDQRTIEIYDSENFIMFEFIPSMFNLH